MQRLNVSALQIHIIHGHESLHGPRLFQQAVVASLPQARPERFERQEQNLRPGIASQLS